MATNFDHKKILKKYRVRLVEELDVNDLILDHLYGEDVFTRHDYDEVYRYREDRYHQNRCLLDKLERKDEEAFHIFHSSLEKKFKHLFYLLKDGGNYPKKLIAIIREHRSRIAYKSDQFYIFDH